MDLPGVVLAVGQEDGRRPGARSLPAVDGGDGKTESQRRAVAEFADGKRRQAGKERLMVDGRRDEEGCRRAERRESEGSPGPPRHKGRDQPAGGVDPGFVSHIARGHGRADVEHEDDDVSGAGENRFLPEPHGTGESHDCQKE